MKLIYAQKTKYLVFTLGAIISIYLTWVHYQPSVLACPQTGVINCSRVLHSPGSQIFGVPLALLGGLWLLAALIAKYKGQVYLLVVSGALGLIWAWGHEYIVHTICLWCTGMQLTVVYALVILVYRQLNVKSEVA